MDEIAVENTFQVFVIMESKMNFGTQWCPQATVRSDFFNCDAEGTERISARLLCNGWDDCPITGTKADESHFVCSPQQIRLLAVMVNLTVYFVALGSATFLICSRRRQPLRATPKKSTLTEEQKKQISKTLGQISRYMNNRTTENEENIKKSVQEMSKQTQLNLIKVAHSIEVRVSEVSENIFEPAVEQVFSKEDQRKELFALMKESMSLSTKIKLDVLETFEPKGWVKRKTLELKQKCSEAVKITLVMIKGILAALVGLLLIPLPEVKDLITIVSLKIFNQDVIQGRTELIDNVPLDDFVTILSVIYGLTFALKLIESRSNTVSSASWHHWIPFVPDIEIALRTIQEVIKRQEVSLMMQYTIDNLEDNEDANSEWLKIVNMALEIEETNLNIEVLGDKKRQIKVVTCIGDILQGCILMVLLLRTDLRIRSLLQFSKMCRKIGIDPKKGDGSGESSW